MLYTITLPNTRKVSEFVGIANKYKGTIKATSGKYTADAKSIMGMLTLDLTKKISVDVNDDDAPAFADDIAEFISK